jgi:hypothetical protein
MPPVWPTQCSPNWPDDATIRPDRTTRDEHTADSARGSYRIFTAHCGFVATVDDNDVTKIRGHEAPRLSVARDGNPAASLRPERPGEAPRKDPIR